jgi:glycosyltransferase involved in cell wall biosynthesis
MQQTNKSGVSLCLMTWNELEGCKHDVPLLPRNDFQQIFAVDGGSTDGTIEYLESEGIPVFQQPVKSLNAAYHHAVNVCEEEKLVIFFPKGTIAPSCVSELSRTLEKGIDFVVASRNIEGGENEEDNNLFRPRKWGVLILSLLSSFIWRREGPRIHDVLHGVKGFTIEAFRQMNIAETGVSIDLEMVIRSYRFKISRAEVPVVEKSRVAGDTHFKVIPTAKRLALFLWNEFTTSIS